MKQGLDPPPETKDSIPRTWVESDTPLSIGKIRVLNANAKIRTHFNWQRAMSLPVQPSLPNAPLKLTLVLEHLASGSVAASVMEFPQCRVEAETPETAIAQIKCDMVAMLERLEFLSIEIPTATAQPSESPWIK